MFGAGASADALVVSAGDPAGACVAAHYAALAYLTDAEHAKHRLGAALDLAHQSGDTRLITLIGAFFAVADLAAGQDDDVRAAVTRLDRLASDDGYDRFILHWAGWMLGLAERDGAVARRWMGLQQEFLDRTGIVETWLTSFSTAMCDVIDGGDVRSILGRTLALADREGFHADADCVLVIAYAEICAGRFEAAAELLGTAIHDRFNATALYVLYRAVLDRLLPRPARRRNDGGRDAPWAGANGAARRCSTTASCGPPGSARWPIAHPNDTECAIAHVELCVEPCSAPLQFTLQSPWAAQPAGLVVTDEMGVEVSAEEARVGQAARQIAQRGGEVGRRREGGHRGAPLTAGSSSSLATNSTSSLMVELSCRSSSGISASVQRIVAIVSTTSNSGSDKRLRVRW